MPAEVAPHGTRVGIVAGAHGRADDEPQLLALVEVADRVGAGRRSESGQYYGHSERAVERVSMQHAHLLDKESHLIPRPIQGGRVLIVRAQPLLSRSCSTSRITSPTIFGRSFLKPSIWRSNPPTLRSRPSNLRSRLSNLLQGCRTDHPRLRAAIGSPQA